jgi:hypothetical protein
MNRPTLLCATVVLLLTCSIPAMPQEQGQWRATSNTAKSVTGDIGFSDTKIGINFSTFIIANIRSLTPAELSAAFDADASAAGTGNLYRLNIPGTKKFLHSRTLCGDEDTQWIATYVTGRNLQLIFFSSSHMPVLTVDAISNSSDLCGVYAYTR